MKARSDSGRNACISGFAHIACNLPSSVGLSENSLRSSRDEAAGTFSHFSKTCHQAEANQTSSSLRTEPTERMLQLAMRPRRQSFTSIRETPACVTKTNKSLCTSTVAKIERPEPYFRWNLRHEDR